jgi:hypothetical protein
MNAEVKKTLDDVAAQIPDTLRTGYEQAIHFDPNTLAAPAIDGGRLRQLAHEESGIPLLSVSIDGVSPGLKGLLRHAALPVLSAWASARAGFDSALHPFVDRINAVREAEQKKVAIDLKAQEKEASIIQQAEAHKPYAEAKEAKTKANLHFEQLHQGDGGRPVVTFGNSWPYFVIMVATTTVEWLINFDALYDWLGRIYALAAGGTIIMAWAVGTAAHLHGTYLKQWSSRFAPHVEGKGRYTTLLMAATLLLLVVLGVAGWARYSLAMQGVVATGPTLPTDQVAAPPNPTVDVLVSLGFNLLVWLIGLIIAFFAHDENHELMDAEHERWKRTRAFNRLHRPWEKSITLAKARATRELDQLRAATTLAFNATKPQRDMLEQVDKRAEVVYRYLATHLQSCADLYRISLGKGLLERKHSVLIDGHTVSAQDYLQRSVELHSALFREIVQ